MAWSDAARAAAAEARRAGAKGKQQKKDIRLKWSKVGRYEKYMMAQGHDKKMAKSWANSYASSPAEKKRIMAAYERVRQYRANGQDPYRSTIGVRR